MPMSKMRVVAWFTWITAWSWLAQIGYAVSYTRPAIKRNWGFRLMRTYLAASAHVPGIPR